MHTGFVCVGVMIDRKGRWLSQGLWSLVWMFWKSLRGPKDIL